MANKTNKTLILEEYGGALHLREVPVPTPAAGQLLIKVEASTINPSDRLFIQGAYFKKPLPITPGFEGVGRVVEANGQEVQSWVGKRVTFVALTGSWGQYALAEPNQTFEIDDNVPESSAASGIVNPLTVIGFIENYRERGLTSGIIHTAAASALGRQLNKYCQREKIPLLNVVRREEQAQILRSEGATNVLVTSGDKWQEELKNYIQNQGFTTVYDALGGGPITDFIISNLPPKGHYFLYGVLENKPLTVSDPKVFFSGVVVTGFLLFPWWATAPQETKERIRKVYGELLKNELSTKTYKEFTLENIKEAIETSEKKATEGKVLLRITH